MRYPSKLITSAGVTRRVLLKHATAAIAGCMASVLTDKASASLLAYGTGSAYGSGYARNFIRHIVPQVPITIDGIEYEPNDIKRFDGQPLHFFPVMRSGYASAMHVFTQARDAFRYTHEFKQLEVIPVLGDRVVIFEHINYQGHDKDFWVNISNLGGCWMYPFHGWNDQISSIQSGSRTTTFYEHVDYKGSSFTMMNNQSISNLVPLGWNDRISSIRINGASNPNWPFSC